MYVFLQTYLGCGIEIKTDKYQVIKASKPELYPLRIARCLWKTSELARRCLSRKHLKKKKMANGQSIILCTPQKVNLYYSKYFRNMWVDVKNICRFRALLHILVSII